MKKPKDLLEYVVVHEMLHLHQPTHSERFKALLAQHYPTWREARAELNALPLAAEVWAGRSPAAQNDAPYPDRECAGTATLLPDSQPGYATTSCFADD